MIAEILWLLLMFGAVLATIVAAVKESKSRAAVNAMMQPAPIPMEVGGDSVDSFGTPGQDQFEFNVDNFK